MSIRKLIALLGFSCVGLLTACQTGTNQGNNGNNQNNNGQIQTGTDTDGDGVADAVDNCPLMANADQADANLDGIGNVCDPSGIWSRVSGKIFSSVSISTNTTTHVEYIVLSGDGTGALYLRDSDSNVLLNGKLTYGPAGREAVSLDLSQFSTAVDGGFVGGQRILTYEYADATTIKFTDSGGNESIYTKVNAVADDAKVKTLGLGNRYTFGVRPVSSWGSMAYDGSSLWFTEQSTANLYPINPSTGALGAAKVLPGGYSYIIACQGTDFWGSCACGSVTDIKRKTQAGVDVDTVDTNALGSALTINSGAWDSNNNVLWLAGSNSLANENRLMRVDSNSNPNVLIGVAKFNSGLRAMTFRGPELWAITSASPQAIIRIDTSTFKAVATYGVPETTTQWAGIAVVGTQLQLLGIVPGVGGVLQAINP